MMAYVLVIIYVILDGVETPMEDRKTEAIVHWVLMIKPEAVETARLMRRRRGASSGYALNQAL